MKEFECADPELKVSNGVVNAFLAAFGPYKSRGQKVLSRHFGVETLSSDPAAWYPLAKFFEGMRELQDQMGQDFLFKVGSFIFGNAAFPPGIDSVEKALASIDQAYKMNHDERAKQHIGSYRWVPDGDRQGRMVVDVPYPCSFDLGIVTSIAQRFQPGAKVRHDDGHCRQKGGDSCTYLVGW